MIRRLSDEDSMGSEAPCSYPPGNRISHQRSSTATNFDYSMVITIIVLLTALFFMAFFSVYIRRFADQNAIDIADRHRRILLRDHTLYSSAPSTSFSMPHGGIGPEVVRALPVFAFNAQQSFDECAVCLAEFEPQEKLKMIPACGHYFHPHCIDRWLSARCSCPLCRSTKLFLPLPKASAELRLDVIDEMPLRELGDGGRECG
ncbi:RING-H2 finger protein ATL57-like [Aristolochia californica]|uniref:RING-H2 finger protein ATL57-like n=1 Tax=Aristolochia californica TaxID=171875 RepID=UPI0035DB79EB